MFELRKIRLEPYGLVYSKRYETFSEAVEAEGLLTERGYIIEIWDYSKGAGYCID